MGIAGDERTHAPADSSLAELVQRATDQMSRLVRDELRLARAELAAKGRHAGIGVGLLGSGGVIVWYAVAVLLAAAVLGLAEALPAWLAALIVGAAMLLAAGVLALVGRGQLRRAVPPVPEGTVTEVRKDIETVTSATQRRAAR